MPNAARETELLHRLKLDLEQLVSRHQALARADFAAAAVCVAVKSRGAAALVAHPEGSSLDQGVAMALALLQPSATSEHDAHARGLLDEALRLLGQVQQIRESRSVNAPSLH